MTRRSWTVAGLAWLAVVVVVSVVTWTVINAAGRDVLGTTSAGDALPSPSTPSAAPSTTPSSGPGGASPRPRATRPATAGGVGSSAGAATASPAGTPSGRPTPAVRDEGGADDSATTQHSSTGGSGSTPPPDPQPVAQTRTWRGAAGTVVARCDGDTISLQSATPADGWGVDVGSRGPEEVEVEFSTGDGSSEQQTKVRAECSGGAPRFSSQSEGDGGGDGGGDD